jgi:prohibitin 1
MAAKFADRFLRLMTIGSLSVVPVAAALYPIMYTVDGGERAIIMDYMRGKVLDDVIGEGTHIRWPIIQKPIIYDVRIKARSIPTATGSKDQQTVNITLRVLYRPVLNKLPEIYKTYGTDYDERIIPSIGNEVMKAVVAQYNATELITQRAEVSRKITERIKQLGGEKYNLDLVDVAITHLTFRPEFTNAVEQKQVAQQAAERAKFLVTKAEFERQAAIIRASGEAEAAQMISDALARSGHGLIALRKIQASKDIAQLLSKSQNVTYLPQQTNVLLPAQK